MTKHNVKVRRTITRCVDCGKPWSRDVGPIVTDKVWKEIQCLPEDHLCEPCMHDRFDFFLERPILFGDLLKCPFNFGWARPFARDNEPITFFDPYVERWMNNESKKFLASKERKLTKH